MPEQPGSYELRYKLSDGPAGTRSRCRGVSFASGNGGNKIYVIPTRRMVVSVASSAYGKAHGQRRSEDILKAILKADATQM